MSFAGRRLGRLTLDPIGASACDVTGLQIVVRHTRDGCDIRCVCWIQAGEFRIVERHVRAENGMPRAVSTPRQLTNGRAEWHAHKGQWTPDGRTIIYTRDADQGNLYTVENYK